MQHLASFFLFFWLFLVLAGQANAQTTKTAQPEPAAAASTSSLPQRASERIRTEDAGSRIDEIRVGGETQSITVQPKTGSSVPAYEVLPNNTKGGAPTGATGGAAGARVWNVLNF